MVTRAGHSLVELIVALVVLGCGLAMVGTTAALGARLTMRAAARQEAVALARSTLDSLLALPAPADGLAGDSAAPTATWTVLGGGGTRVVRVTVPAADGGPAVELAGLLGPAPPPLRTGP